MFESGLALFEMTYCSQRSQNRKRHRSGRKSERVDEATQFETEPTPDGKRAEQKDGKTDEMEKE